MQRQRPAASSGEKGEGENQEGEEKGKELTGKKKNREDDTPSVSPIAAEGFCLPRKIRHSVGAAALRYGKIENNKKTTLHHVCSYLYAKLRTEKKCLFTI